MSRHFFECEMRCEVRVMLGHEEANGYVLEVMRIGGDLGDGRSRFLYASKGDPCSTGDDLDYYREKLKKLGLDVPESMFEAVEGMPLTAIGPHSTSRMGESWREYLSKTEAE